MKRKCNVLIVDDEFLARKLLTEYVSKLDYLNLVDTCADATKAMEVLNNEQIDILLLDIQMPDISGMEMLRLINNKPAVILTTAYSTEMQQIRINTKLTLFPKVSLCQLNLKIRKSTTTKRSLVHSPLSVQQY